MEMSKEQFKEVMNGFKWSCVLSTADASDIEDILNFVHDIYAMEADAIREKCPWASRAIEECETVARRLSFDIGDIIDLFEGEEVSGDE